MLIVALAAVWLGSPAMSATGADAASSPRDEIRTGTVVFLDASGREWSGDGYVEIDWDYGGYQSRIVPIRAGRWSVHAPSFVTLGCRAILGDGRLGRVVSMTRDLTRDLTIRAFLLERPRIRVRAPHLGGRVDEVFVLRGRDAELTGGVHPGAFPADRVRSIGGNTVELDIEPELHCGVPRWMPGYETVWVRAPGCAWARVDVRYTLEGTYRVVLQPAGRLHVEARSLDPADYVQIWLEDASTAGAVVPELEHLPDYAQIWLEDASTGLRGGFPGMFPGLVNGFACRAERGGLRLDHLRAGRYRLTAYHDVIGDGVLAETEVELAAGDDLEVRLDLAPTAWRASWPPRHVCPCDALLLEEHGDVGVDNRSAQGGASASVVPGRAWWNGAETFVRVDAGFVGTVIDLEHGDRLDIGEGADVEVRASGGEIHFERGARPARLRLTHSAAAGTAAGSEVLVFVADQAEPSHTVAPGERLEIVAGGPGRR